MTRGRRREREREASSSALPDFEPSSVPVLQGETVGEFCARISAMDEEDERVELLWGGTMLPKFEILQALTTTKPWQLDLSSGRERLLLRVPPSCSRNREMEKYMKVKVHVKLEEKERQVEEDVAREKKRAKVSVESASKGEPEGAVSVDPVPGKKDESARAGSEKASGRAVNTQVEPLRPPAIKVAIVRDAVEKLRRPTGKRHTRPLMDFYRHDALEDMAVRKATRRFQVADRYRLADSEAFGEGAKYKQHALTEEEWDLAAQLQALASGVGDRSNTKPKSRAPAPGKSLPYVPSEPDVTRQILLLREDVKNVSIPATARVRKVAVYSGELSTIWAKVVSKPRSVPMQHDGSNMLANAVPTSITDSFESEPVDMSKIRSTTFGCMYYMGVVSEALQSVTCMPSSMICH